MSTIEIIEPKNASAFAFSPTRRLVFGDTRGDDYPFTPIDASFELELPAGVVLYSCGGFCPQWMKGPIRDISLQLALVPNVSAGPSMYVENLRIVSDTIDQAIAKQVFAQRRAAGMREPEKQPLTISGLFTAPGTFDYEHYVARPRIAAEMLKERGPEGQKQCRITVPIEPVAAYEGDPTVKPRENIPAFILNGAIPRNTVIRPVVRLVGFSTNQKRTHAYLRWVVTSVGVVDGLSYMTDFATENAFGGGHVWDLESVDVLRSTRQESNRERVNRK